MATRPDSNADSVAAAIAAMKEAADSLAETAASTIPGAQESTSDASTETLYHQHLHQRGQLVDVDDTTDLNTLPPEVTHVRLPNGRVRRLGYS
jgi:hypothetical protein